METWSFDLVTEGHRRPLILRRRPGPRPEPAPSAANFMQAPDLETEGELLRLARRMGVPVPAVVARSAPEDALGDALLMTRLAGEALPQRILRRDEYQCARERLAFQCGEALGNLHRSPLDECPAGLRDLGWEDDLDRLQRLCDHFGNPSPAHQLALNWLRSQPPPKSARVLCHGDFRMGNLLVGENGLVAVLDWELAHLGFAGEDLGYLCANVWRFGGGQPVGGFGAYRQLLDGYRSVRDTAPSLEELKLWELYAALGWGLVCLTMLEMVRDGSDPTLERAAVGRRLSESEIDILLLLEELPA
jgi:aminoglycoside phosphotransferase (APT) family kinase protein